MTLHKKNVTFPSEDKLAFCQSNAIKANISQLQYASYDLQYIYCSLDTIREQMRSSAPEVQAKDSWYYISDIGIDTFHLDDFWSLKKSFQVVWPVEQTFYSILRSITDFDG